MEDCCRDCGKDIKQEVEYKENHIKKDLHPYDGNSDYICGECFDNPEKGYKYCPKCELGTPKNEMTQHNNGNEICKFCKNE